MKKIVSVIFILFAVIAAYLAGQLRASDTVTAPDANWALGSEAAQAWQELLISQEAAAARIISTTQNEPQDRLEGLDMLSDLLSFSLEMKTDKGDPLRPVFTDWMGDYRKVFGDVGDAVYHTAELSPQYNYVISGNMGEADYIGFQLYGTNPLNGWNRATANINTHDMIIDEDQNFTLMISSEKQSTDNNHLLMSDDAHMVMVRQYFFDRPNSRPATVSISIIETQDVLKKRRPETEAARAHKIRSATYILNGVIDGTFAMRDLLSVAPNHPDPPQRYDPDFAGIFYPTVDNEYFGTWYNIAADEALIIEGKVPSFKPDAAGYWSVSLQNRWMQSLDYVSRQTSLNSRNLVVRGDGTYRIVLAHSDHFKYRKPSDAVKALMGIDGNWLETDGHKEGLIAVRYQLAQNHERPDIKLVKLK